MLLETLRANREAIANACRQFGARRIRVFGSVARGEGRPDSDIDFLVDLPPRADVREAVNLVPFSYALARVSGEPLLFKGDDFGQTDVSLVQY